MESIRRILVVCNVTEACQTLIHEAAALARSKRARLVILTVIDNPFGVRGLAFPRPSLQEDLRKLVAKNRRELQDIISRERQGITVQELLREGRTLDRILEAVREENIDLLILPAHYESRLEHLLFGGKNKALLRMMPCSLLYIKSEPLAVVEDLDEEEQGQEAEAA
jgi:nucleotide-binding universal stress UspA family protein